MTLWDLAHIAGKESQMSKHSKGAGGRPQCTCTTPAGSEHSPGCPSYHRKGTDDGE